MRLWSIHPCYLDAKGLVALWREGLLAQAVLAGQTKGYRHHPQLTRFLQSGAPQGYMSNYLQAVHAESLRRGYHFDQHKIGEGTAVKPLPVTRGQLDFEWQHLRAKLEIRDPDRLKQFEGVAHPAAHPLFRVVKGPVAPWEVIPASTG